MAKSYIHTNYVPYSPDERWRIAQMQYLLLSSRIFWCSLFRGFGMDGVRSAETPLLRCRQHGSMGCPGGGQTLVWSEPLDHRYVGEGGGGIVSRERGAGCHRHQEARDRDEGSVRSRRIVHIPDSSIPDPGRLRGVLGNFGVETFSGHLGNSFRIHPDVSSTLHLELVSATGLNEGSERPFSIVFRGPTDALLPQRIYRMEHEEIGAFDLFLVPIGPDEKGLRYEAIFT